MRNALPARPGRAGSAGRLPVESVRALASRKPPAPQGPQIQPAPQVQLQQDPVTNRQRAEIHTELAAGYYERAQMNVALEELGIAEKFDPTYARIYNLYGLVYTVMGELPRAEQQFKRALELAPNDADTRHNWGWYLCTHGRERESIAEFEVAIRNPLYKHAGDRAGQRRQVQRRDRRRWPPRTTISAARCSCGRTTPSAAYNLALLELQGRTTARVAGADEDRAAADVTPAPEALFLGMCIERKLGDRQSEQSYVDAASQPLSGVRRDARHRHRRLRMSEQQFPACAGRHSPRMRTRRPARSFAPRARRTACRSTPSRST